jgi:glycerate dehydrogenase
VLQLKIVVLDGYTLNPGDLSWEGISQFGDLTVYDRTAYKPGGEDLVVERAREADAILLNKTLLNREMIGRLPNLKYVGVLATGYNIVDIEAARERDIVVTNVPTYGTTAVAQMTFALLLELCHHVGEHSRAVHNGEWVENPDWSFWKYPLVELAGKSMGIIGYGRIGSEVGKIAKAFGMEVLAMASSPKPELETESLRFAPLDEILEKSDVISLHVPLFDSTKGMINKESIDKMKRNVMIINTSRGPLIVEEDLAEALNTGRIAGAALDVVSSEPIDPDNPLLKADNCILTPHIAWAPKESRKRLMDVAVKNLKEFLDGNPINVVNK